MGRWNKFGLIEACKSGVKVGRVAMGGWTTVWSGSYRVEIAKVQDGSAWGPGRWGDRGRGADATQAAVRPSALGSRWGGQAWKPGERRGGETGGEMAERRRFCRLEGLGAGLRGEDVFREGPLRAGDLGKEQG